MLARDRGEVLFMTGAGVSVPPPSNLPNFQGLVIDIYEKADQKLAAVLSDWAAAEAARLPTAATTPWPAFAAGLDARQQTELKRFASAEYDVALGMLERRMAREGRENRVRRAAMEVLGVDRAPNSLHRALNVLGRRDDKLFLATTNFDRLHERAAGRHEPLRLHAPGNMPRPSRRRDFAGVFHIHGLIDPGGAPSDLVLTDQDFGDAYLRRRYAADFIYDAVRIFHLVIIGYSLNDAPFRYLLNAVAGDSLHFPDLKNRFALVSCAPGDETVAEEWNARSIRPICYDPKDRHVQLQALTTAWAESAPRLNDDRWATSRLRAMSRRPHRDASEADRSVFGYILRRSTRRERARIMDALGVGGAAPDWLDAANAVLRDAGAPA